MYTYPDVIVVKKKGPNGAGRGKDIQKAIDKALKRKRYCTVYIPCGLWLLDQPLRLHPKPSDTPTQIYGDPGEAGISPALMEKRQACIDATQEDALVHLNFSVNLIGARPAFGGQGAANSFTVLECTYNNAPAIEIQATRATTVANLAIEGQNRGVQALMDERFLHLHRDDIWLDPGVTEDHIGIAIDREEGTGSSIVLIDNVNARYFAAGISIGTSGHPCTLNSESHLIRRFHGQYLGKAGVILGHHQTKGVTITDSFFFGQQYWIDTVRKGLRNGHPPTIRGCTVGGTQRLFNLHHAWGQFKCDGLFVESFLSIGTVGWGGSAQNPPAVFTGCQFDFFQQGLDNSAAMPHQSATEELDVHLLCERPVLFQGCGFKFNRAQEFKAYLRIHNTQQVVFDTCTFGWESKNGRPPLAFNREEDTVDGKLIQYAILRHCSFHSNDPLLPPNWWRMANSALVSDKQVSIQDAEIKRENDGSVTVTYTGSKDIRVGDFIGLPHAIYWNPQLHVPELQGTTSHNSNLPFGIVAEITQLPADTTQLVLHQVATSIYQQLSPTTQHWNLRRYRSLD